MPRKVRDSNLETRSARARLKVSAKPVFRLIEPQLHLGYRKLASGPGTWVVRRYAGQKRYRVENLRTPDGLLIVADDFSDPDGHSVLSFGQAQERAKVKRPAAATQTSPYTVANAMDDYFRFLEEDGRAGNTVRDAKYRDTAFIRPLIGTERVEHLTADKLRRWRDGLVKSGPRLRTRKGKPQKHRQIFGDDAKRARRSSVNRVWALFRAALNHAFRDGKVASDLEWRKIKPFAKADGARVRYLTVAEAKRLTNASDSDFRPLVQAALQTGARYSELARLRVADFNPDVGTLHVRQSKSGKPRHIVLTDEGQAFFKQLTAGRSGDDLMLSKADGSAWRDAHQLRPMTDAVAVAKIKPAITFHGLRHTWASHAVMNGVPLLVVAKNLGHADTRMVEKHYAHLAPSYTADAIRAGAPKFGFKPSGKVVKFDAR